MNYTDEQIKEQIIKKRRAKKRRRLNLLRLFIITLAFLIAFYSGILLGNKRYEADIATYSVDGDNPPIVQTAVAEADVKNNGGKKFWSWYGYDYHVSWCATFVSWCGTETGLIKKGKMPKYAACGDGVNWFKNHKKWLKGGEIPESGDIIFFNWDQKPGYVYHTGIVSGVVGDYVFTVEGNSSDRCRRKRYKIDSPVILGYGIID